MNESYLTPQTPRKTNEQLLTHGEAPQGPTVFDSIVMAGGYTIIHLLLKLLKKRNNIVKNLKIDLQLSDHFTEETHESLLKVPWGQVKKDFPDESKEFLPNFICSDVAIESVKSFCIKAVQYFKTLNNIKIYRYKNGSLEIVTEGEELIIKAEDAYEIRYPFHAGEIFPMFCSKIGICMRFIIHKKTPYLR